MIYHVSDIEWDVQDENTDEGFSVDVLPKETDMDVEAEDGEAVETVIADKLSDIYGFCVKGFTFTPVKSTTVWRVSLNYDLWFDKPLSAKLSVQEDVSRTQLPDKLVTRQWYNQGGIHVENTVETESGKLVGKAKETVLRELVERLHALNKNIYEEVRKFVKDLSKKEE